MSIFDGYRREKRKEIEPGIHRVCITDVKESVSSKGNPMLIITVQPSGSNIKINHYIVKNDYFNENLTDLYDSFDIPEGDFNYLSWIGAVGAARLIEDSNGYLKVKRFVDRSRQNDLPEWEGEMPERQTVNKSFAEVSVEDEDLPF